MNCPTVSQIVAFNGQDEREMLRVAACLEEHFPHSVANAVVRAARERGLNHREMHSEPEYVVAHGIATRIGGERAVIGSRHFVFEDEGAKIRPEDQLRFDALDPGCSWLYLAIGGVLSAAIGILDPLRPEAEEIVELLHQAGIGKTVMLTGDSRNTAGLHQGGAGAGTHGRHDRRRDQRRAGTLTRGCGHRHRQRRDHRPRGGGHYDRRGGSAGAGAAAQAFGEADAAHRAKLSFCHGLQRRTDLLWRSRSSAAGHLSPAAQQLDFASEHGLPDAPAAGIKRNDIEKLR